MPDIARLKKRPEGLIGFAHGVALRRLRLDRLLQLGR
jgi:hypothetical protein